LALQGRGALLMLEQAKTLKVEIDWEELILEIQTDPGDELTDNHWTLYETVYGSMVVSARRWLENRNLTEARDGALAAIGIDKIFKIIDKFDIPDDDSSGIGRAFKAWALKCCAREWSKQKDLLREVELDSDKFNQFHSGIFPSPEEVLIAEVPSNKPVSRPVTDRALIKRILAEELNRFPQSMKEALLESEDLKSVENPNSRGKQGEAANIAEKYGFTQGAIRTSRSRLLKKIRDRFEQEVKA